MDEIAHTARADAVAGQHPVPLLRCQWVGGAAIHHSVQGQHHDRILDRRRNQSQSAFPRIDSGGEQQSGRVEIGGELNRRKRKRKESEIGMKGRVDRNIEGREVSKREKE